MKRAFTAFAAFLIFFSCIAQINTSSINFDGLERTFVTYVPDAYETSTPTPLVIALHGLGGSQNDFLATGMTFVADTANFILVSPQAITDPVYGATAWNSGAGAFGISLNASIDDIGFLSALIAEMADNYNVDMQRVYCTGFSMGGFMTNRVGCEMSNTIAAIASVAGTIGGEYTCNAGQKIPMCHFHGTVDGTVGYDNNIFGTQAEETVAFWANHNGCDSSPTITAISDTQDDNYSVEHWVYNNCDENTDVELWKVINADHVWLGPQNDIDYSKEIWKFFLRYQLNDAVDVESKTSVSINVFPNPAREFLNIDLTAEWSSIKLYDMMGRLVFHEKTNAQRFTLPNTFTSGNYVIEVETSTTLFREKIVFQ